MRISQTTEGPAHTFRAHPGYRPETLMMHLDGISPVGLKPMPALQAPFVFLQIYTLRVKTSVQFWKDPWYLAGE